MPYYRIYLMSAERHITAVRESECPDDDAALTEAAGVIDSHAGAEVWSLERLVGYVPSPHGAPPGGG